MTADHVLAPDEWGASATRDAGFRFARLVPVDRTDPLADLRARGLVREPTAPRERRGEAARLKAANPVSDLVADQRR
jgi:hypothetical protein